MVGSAAGICNGEEPVKATPALQAKASSPDLVGDRRGQEILTERVCFVPNGDKL
jgi:hypothetical protein